MQNKITPTEGNDSAQLEAESALRDAACSPFRFEIGKTYETQAGEMVTVLGRTDSKGYECLECSDDRYRYDRSTSGSDAGRVTGTPHDYSYPHNFKRENDKILPQ